MSLPYFEGDFWPNTIEDCIRDVEKEENERKKFEQMAAADDDEDDLFQVIKALIGRKLSLYFRLTMAFDSRRTTSRVRRRAT